MGNKMKVKIEIDLQKATYETLDKMAKALNMKGIEELLAKEVVEGIDNLNLWLDRFDILRTRYPSLFLKKWKSRS